jgi:hypothetical protein
MTWREFAFFVGSIAVMLFAISCVLLPSHTQPCPAGTSPLVYPGGTVVCVLTPLPTDRLLP